ncbi:CHAD domain-containing protein [Rhodovulum adriaticum]|uniref:CHAD domain-containing protein n=1 Tax=Rhodovulum adriaticum TaxID=35804 RepID=A0A4V2SKW5_RHOAD|nr:CHAD domain-containing protein [Rhodovulum adriaticum]MBK1635419.1 hypothetical protein [Rhodovulum adriaticum]TCP21126.1 CHAD domain-containing protein [Rhodovulum adriaticum]
MAYRVKRSDKSVQAALRRIAVQEIDAGLAELDNPDMDLHDKVHQLRKRAKRLRGLLRLVRPAFPGYAAENEAIRDAARRLSGLRDSEGMVETYDKLVAAAHLSGFARVRAHLVSLRDAAAARAHVEQDLAAFRAALLDLRGRAAKWRLTEDGFAAMQDGLEKAFARARKARAAAAEDPAVERIHDWRKRVKDHWYHTRILAPLNPQVMDHRAQQARDLSEMLGDHHDLDVLDYYIARAADLPGDPALWAAFRGHIAARQNVLENEAQNLGARLFASPARDLGRRWARWWKHWKGA